LYPNAEFEEIDIDPDVEDYSGDELVEEFGAENFQLANYYLHRRHLYDLHVLGVQDLEWDDLAAFFIIDEEKGLRQAEDHAKLQDKTRSL
jgi:hypothetical protein